MKRLILSPVLIAFVAFLCNNAFAYDFSAVCESGQTLYYNITSNTEPYTVEITNEISENFYGDNVNYYNNGNMNSPSGNMLIPTIVTYNNREYTVVSIGEAAFCRCTGLTSVTIPSTIVSIGKGAFCRCNGLVSIVIPNSVTSIGEMVFYYCSGLTSVTLPNSVTIISDLAFFYCGRLASVTIGDFVTSIGLQAFYNCETLASITIPGTVTSIGKYDFYNCRGLASITIPNSVTSVDELAFGGCSGLTSVTIPDSGVRFGAKIFEGCVGLTEPVYNAECFVVFPCGYATEYTIPDGIQQIVGGAFKNCTELADIIIPNSVDSIGQEAFYSCSGLTSITIPNSVTSIGGSAFSGCTGLTEITIPNSVNSIEGSAFRNCTSIQTVNFNATRCIKMGMFSMAVFYGCSSLTTLNIGNNVTYIPEAAFACCSELTGSLTIPNSVDSIGEDAFKYCGLSEIILPNSIHRIEYSTFNYCTNLTSFVIPNSVTYIGGYAFASCNVMTSITIPNTVTYIGESAFQDCQALASITIPDSVTYIGYCAFQNCIGLTSIIIPNSITSIYQSTFENCQALTLITIPNSVINIDTYAFRSCNSLTSINIPNSVTSIGNYVFQYCSELSSITFGSGVTSIGNYVFSGCSELDSIYSLALVPPTVSQYTFESLSSDLPIIIPCGCYSAYNSAAYWNRFTNMQPYCHSYTLSVISANPDQGTVSGGGTYLEGTNTEATIEAIANDGYLFVSWNDGNTENPRTIEVISDTTFIATFAIARTVTIESSNTDMGYVIGSGVYAEGAEVEITAVPYEGYRFDHWVDVDNPLRDFNTDNPRTIVVSTDVTYMAVFTDVTSIEENVAQEISIFPNPTTNILNITSSETISEIEIVNMMGQVVKRMEVNSENAACDVEDLKAGVYMVRIRTLRYFGGAQQPQAQGAVISQRKFVKE